MCSATNSDPDPNLLTADAKARSYQQEVASLEASVKALESSVGEIRNYIERENATIPKVG